MKKAGFIRQAQRGFSLIEAMVSIVLVAILGLGMTYAASRVLQVQRFATTQSLAVIQMREYLQTGEQPEVEAAQKTAYIIDSSQSGDVAISISGAQRNISLFIRSRSLEVSSTELFSGDGTMSIAY
ncbi:type II secretion system protein [Halopseudomonas xiamenensis]|uniref:type II secretion system protein n=1 Tax=Halopseudomonas xiamenensis TaxID=157792 RepID=UPI001628EBF4|nr:prepilin-type N-terminal cleavage/methylation domain-containing protein [Halopseudomonas xiamenensis]